MSTPITFTKAVRRAVPLLLGIVGPSGTGKTFSAMRLARGMQRVMGGRIKVIDTEHNRALQYADYFDFDHFPFDPPYSSHRYLEVIKAAAAIPGPTVVDSMSHEHEGPGGYLDYHDKEVQRLLGCGFRTEQAANVPAWAKPARARQDLINGIITSGFNGIFCFRAKEKVDMNAKRDDGSRTVGNLGWMPIAGDAFVFEMTAKCLLLPGANGIPTWNPEFPGEKNMAKIPIFFQEIFRNPQQLSEDIGEHLARWASGSAGPQIPRGGKEILAAIAAAETKDELQSLWDNVVKPQWKSLSTDEQKSIPGVWKDRLATVTAPGYKMKTAEADQPQESDEPRSSGERKPNPNYIPGVSLPEEEFL